MALVYEKIVGDKTVILEPREAAIRVPLASANAWTELRIGIALSLTSVAASNAAYPSESFLASTVYDRFAFGLKNSDTDDLPGSAGTHFWGMLTTNGRTPSLAHTTGAFDYGIPAGHSLPHLVIAEGTTITNQTGATTGTFNCPDSTETQAATSFASWLLLRFVIANRGTATQTVQFSQHSVGGITDTSETALRTRLNDLTGWPALNTALAANDGVTAYTVPDAFFFRSPLITSRVRLHNVMVMQSAP